MASPPKLGYPGPHRPPPTEIHGSDNDASFVGSGALSTNPTTPTSRYDINEGSHRHLRSSEQKPYFETLPGHRWDKLDIDREKERHPDREVPATTTVRTSLDQLLLGTVHAQPSERQPGSDSGNIKVPLEISRVDKGRPRQRKSKVAKKVPRENISLGDTDPAGLVETRKSKPGASQDPDAVETARPLSLPSSHTTQDSSSKPSFEDIQRFSSNMARRPGRNQVDYVVELKEAIADSLSKLSGIQAKTAPLGQQITTLEEELKAKEADGTITQDDARRLDDLYRNMLKLTEQELGILHQPPDDLVNKMGILNALAVKEDTPAPGRGSTVSKQRGSKRSAIEPESAAVDSPVPSPSEVRTSDQLRRIKVQGQRSSSVASQTPRDGSSRLGDTSYENRPNILDRSKFLVLHAEVAYKQNKSTNDSDGERIHCTINHIRKDKASGKLIYDIKDKDDGEDLLYTAGAEELLPIPSSSNQLPTFAPGKHVIALYPNTTTFYNAQVINMIAKRDVYSLKFEGEENEKEVKEVERRYVLDTKAK